MVHHAKRGRPPDRPDRRESIMDAALACFVERGFYGTAIPQIADKANIAAGTIYHYFESKEALVNALYRDVEGSDRAARVHRVPAGGTGARRSST